MALRAAGSEKESVFGPRRTTGPYFSCSLICVTSGRRFHTSMNRHQSVNEARKGPGYLLSPRRYRFPTSQAVSKTPTIVSQCRATRRTITSVIPCIFVLVEKGAGERALLKAEMRRDARFGMLLLTQYFILEEFSGCKIGSRQIPNELFPRVLHV